jgi:hypothetical protein
VAKENKLWNIGGITLAKGNQIIEYWWNKNGKSKSIYGILVE